MKRHPLLYTLVGLMAGAILVGGVLEAAPSIGSRVGVFAANRDNTYGPLNGYPHATATAVRLIVDPANAVARTSALANGNYDCQPSAKMFCIGGLGGSLTVTPATGNYLPGDPAGPWPVTIDGTTEDRIACITTSGTAYLQCSARTF